jgi:hypothetical protein
MSSDGASRARRTVTMRFHDALVHVRRETEIVGVHHEFSDTGFHEE